jgi:Ser/Thr protein kinase RdoA (MazF antagonist)
MAAFAELRGGDPAPPWVRGGIAAAWRLEAPSVTLIAVSENATFLVTAGDATRMVVRLARPGYAESAAHVSSELLWIEALVTDGVIRTPRPVRTVDGTLLASLRDGQGGRWTAVAFEHVAGTMLEDQLDAGGDAVAPLAEIGRLTARLHAHARRWRSPDGFLRFSWDTADMVGPAARWGHWTRAPLAPGQQSVLQEAEDAALRTLAVLGVDRSPRHFGLIHADLRPSNVMVNDGGLTVIDFDDCGYGYYLYDFAAALTFYEHRPQAAAMATAWLEGYQSVAPLTAEDVRAACALSMLRRLTILGWTTTHREDALPPGLAGEYLPGTVEVAGRYLADGTWLAPGRPPGWRRPRPDGGRRGESHRPFG